MAGAKLKEGTRSIVGAASAVTAPQPGTLAAALAAQERKKKEEQARARAAAAPAQQQQQAASATAGGAPLGFSGLRTKLAGMGEKAQGGIWSVASTIAAKAAASVPQSSAAAALPPALPPTPQHHGLVPTPLGPLARGSRVDLSDSSFMAAAAVFRVMKEKEVDGEAASPAVALVPRLLALGKVGNRLLVLTPTVRGEMSGAGTTEGDGDGDGEGRGASPSTTAATVRANHSLSDLAKVSFSRKRPARLAIWYKPTPVPRGPGSSAAADGMAAEAAEGSSASSTSATQGELRERVYHFSSPEEATAFLGLLQKAQMRMTQQ